MGLNLNSILMRQSFEQIKIIFNDNLERQEYITDHVDALAQFLLADSKEVVKKK